MKIVKLSMIVLLVFAAVRISEAAEETKPKEDKRFSDELSFSLVNTTGNSDTLALAGKNDMKYKFTDKWTGSWVAGALYNKSDGEKTAKDILPICVPTMPSASAGMHMAWAAGCGINLPALTTDM